ncbi:hypothetical protein P168DRAFT_278688 [Aspergillus campestris IBT 28561]|uniref:Uncharacterized protein n=1 Tax=Aspergillus campestris (strain IBT 28561) TaxID=1392248 RepID=A0A2I1DH33_ASPC2|nr:uncharacterized protein P168DRAFT_278688 [Aspergillus campestris IBT 28561]PKY09184.1 hypothetical protein P168DRAFT_278688 [Aspergillus campestris IBT 28561]
MVASSVKDDASFTFWCSIDIYPGILLSRGLSQPRFLWCMHCLRTAVKNFDPAADESSTVKCFIDGKTLVLCRQCSSRNAVCDEAMTGILGDGHDLVKIREFLSNALDRLQLLILSHLESYNAVPAAIRRVYLYQHLTNAGKLRARHYDFVFCERRCVVLSTSAEISQGKWRQSQAPLLTITKTQTGTVDREQLEDKLRGCILSCVIEREDHGCNI